MTFDSTSRWTLDKNKNKREPTHPDYKGKLTDAYGNEFWLKGWIKDGPNGKFISGTVRRREQPSQNAYAQAHGRPQPRDPISTGKRSIVPDDDLGF